MHSLPTFMTSLTTAHLFIYCIIHRNSGGKLPKNGTDSVNRNVVRMSEVLFWTKLTVSREILFIE